LKYSRLTEPTARDEYAQILKNLGHKNVSVHESGLVIVARNMFIGASPDGMVSCDCCGQGILEIKCPLSIAHLNPKDAPLAYLQEVAGGSRHLKENHSYYSQIQTQMAATGKMWCDFFIFTRHGYYLERIDFNANHWKKLLGAAEFFFQNDMAPFLMNGDDALVPDSEIPLQPTPVPSATVQKPTENELMDTPHIPKRARRGRGKRQRCSIRPIYLCGTCDNQCMEADQIVGDVDNNSVQCDVCNRWYHWGCAGFDSEDPDESEWQCIDCEI
jgi:hypothetical protein